jgi:hypothetical protein
MTTLHLEEITKSTNGKIGFFGLGNLGKDDLTEETADNRIKSLSYLSQCQK